MSDRTNNIQSAAVVSNAARPEGTPSLLQFKTNVKAGATSPGNAQPLSSTIWYCHKPTG
ncbi:hypothetical protein LZC95_09250 [Pendulispora brunnea]|uniref:Uncharacterized protein n=1 Tax=Pendulispora brunnea TaxID=2905690 RepID=A0ABZ2KEK4_9BACT